MWVIPILSSFADRQYYIKSTNGVLKIDGLMLLLLYLGVPYVLSVSASMPS